MTTTSINDTLVQLENLHQAYSAILEAAKKQLEGLEVSPEVVEQITAALADRTELKQSVATSVYNSLGADFRETDGEFFDSFSRGRFVRTVRDEVITKVDELIKDKVNAQVEEVIQSGYIARVLERKVKENDAINHALVVSSRLSTLLQQLPSIETE